MKYLDDYKQFLFNNNVEILTQKIENDKHIDNDEKKSNSFDYTVMTFDQFYDRIMLAGE
jgi:hypothetical protein